MKYLTGVRCTDCERWGRYGEVTVEVLFFDAQGKRVGPEDRYTRMHATGLIQCSNHVCLAPYAEVPGKPFAVKEVLFSIRHRREQQDRERLETDCIIAIGRKHRELPHTVLR